MNSIVTNTCHKYSVSEEEWGKAMQDSRLSAIREAHERAIAYDEAQQKAFLPQIVPGFEDKAIVTVNEPPPQHDWSAALLKLQRLAEEDAGLKPVNVAVTIAVTNQPSWTMEFHLVQRNEADSARRELQDVLVKLWNAFTKQPRSKATFVVSEKHE